MKRIESYNASYPLSYYDIGAVYSFYGSSDVSNTTPASADMINRYANKLLALEQEEASNAIKPMPTTKTAIRVGLSRYYAVVVDKTSAQNSSGITVMFINRTTGETEYLLRKYSVSHPAYLDGKNLMPVSTSTNYGLDKSVGKPGQLTKVKSEKVGQLTHCRSQATPVSNRGSIGQLTHVKPSPEPKEPTVGQLTWVKKAR